MIRANLCGRRYTNLYGNWFTAYKHVAKALNELGIEVRTSPILTFEEPLENTTIGIEDSPEDIYIYNHTYLEDIKRSGFKTGKKVIFLKPTAPTPEHFTLDTEGYACSSTITYEKPPFLNFDETLFFKTKAVELRESSCSKWTDRQELQFSTNEVPVPDNHVLLIGQMPGDETVIDFSFGDHWKKFCSIVNYLKDKEPLVIKIHPTLERESLKSNLWFNEYYLKIQEWRHLGIHVYYGWESMHKILPKTKVAIVENSTSGVECMLYDVPIISFGYPEYHWVTKDLRHLHKLAGYINDLSWFSKTNSRKWLAWYCTEYQCYDYKSTLSRLEFLLKELLLPTQK